MSFEDGFQGDNTMTHQPPTRRGEGVVTESVKDIVTLNERRLALTELKIKLQSQDQLTLAGAVQIIDEMLAGEVMWQRLMTAIGIRTPCRYAKLYQLRGWDRKYCKGVTREWRRRWEMEDAA